jgi:predicted transcriptional regulator
VRLLLLPPSLCIDEVACGIPILTTKYLNFRVVNRNRINISLNLIKTEIDMLQSVVAEIYDTERRKELSREYEKKKKSEDNPKSYKINVVSYRYTHE